MSSNVGYGDPGPGLGTGTVEPRLGLLARIRASLKNPSLVSREGYHKRLMKVQWWVVFWRATILLQIPETAIFCPDQFASLPYAFVLLAIAGAYTILYAWVAMRTRVGGTMALYVADLFACSALMFLAPDSKLLFVMSFYSFSSLLSRPTTDFRIAAPATVFLSLAFVGAQAAIGLPPQELVTHVEEMGNFVLYYFWGLGFVGFSAVLERVSSLELDTLLEEQRRSYRRRLHDDLGNTLCGLHFKIQSLARLPRGDEAKRSLEFLTRGYERATAVLKQLISGMDEDLDENLCLSLERLCGELEEETGLHVRLQTPAGVCMSPELQREVLSIVRESVGNASRHAGVEEVFVELKKRGRQLQLTVSDQGKGFDSERLEARRKEGGVGITGMQERAELIRADIDVQSRPGAGTTITLKLNTGGGSGVISRMLDSDPGRCSGGLYTFLVRLRLCMLGWTLLQLLMLTGSRELNAAILVVAALLCADCLAYVFFREPLYHLLNRVPWLLALEQVGLAALVYISLQVGYPFFFALYVGVAVIMNGLFLNVVENTLMTLFLNAGIIAAFALAPPATAGILPGHHIEEPLQHTTIFLILGFSSGLAGEFVKNLEALQQQAIRRVLSRQREQMCARTHRQLHALVSQLGNDIAALTSAGREQKPLEAEAVARLEGRSTDLKVRLRAIIRSLDDEEMQAALSDAA